MLFFLLIIKVRLPRTIAPGINFTIINDFVATPQDVLDALAMKASCLRQMLRDMQQAHQENEVRILMFFIVNFVDYIIVIILFFLSVIKDQSARIVTPGLQITIINRRASEQSLTRCISGRQTLNRIRELA